MIAAALAAFDGDSGVAIEPATFATIPAAVTLRQRCYAELILGLRAVVGRRLGRGAAPCSPAPSPLACPSTSTTTSCCPTSAIAALHVGDTRSSEDYLERLLTAARSSGAVVTVLYALTRLAFSDVPHGRWSTAVARQEEALRLGESTGQAGPRRDAARHAAAAVRAPRRRRVRPSARGRRRQPRRSAPRRPRRDPAGCHEVGQGAARGTGLADRVPPPRPDPSSDHQAIRGARPGRGRGVRRPAGDRWPLDRRSGWLRGGHRPAVGGSDGGPRPGGARRQP